jgi:hypothetical protein
MVISVSSQKIKRIRPKLTSGQKEARQEKFTNLTHALDTARNKYQEEAQTISATYGRLVIIYNSNHFFLAYPAHKHIYPHSEL